MVRFSEREGFCEPKLDLSIETIPKGLRSGLWDAALGNLVYPVKEEDDFLGWTYTGSFLGLIRAVWREILEEPRDALPPSPDDAFQTLRILFFDASFPDFYDILEALHSNLSEYCSKRARYLEQCNEVFEAQKAAVRFVDGKLVQIVDAAEIDEVNTAAQSSSTGVSAHISRAIELYSDRANPDYRNSIKEAISAVEAAAKQITDKRNASLNDALKVLEKQGLLHKALKNGFGNLYGWTSDADGIRHAMLEESDLTEADARYMLVSCSAFANYLLGKGQI